MQKCKTWKIQREFAEKNRPTATAPYFCQSSFFSKFVMPGIRAVQYVRNGRNTLIGSTQLGLRVSKKRFFCYEKRFLLRKKLTPGRAEVICINLLVFRPVDFHKRFFFAITPPFLGNPRRAAIICICLLRSFTFPGYRRGSWGS